MDTSCLFLLTDMSCMTTDWGIVRLIVLIMMGKWDSKMCLGDNYVMIYLSGFILCFLSLVHLSVFSPPPTHAYKTHTTAQSLQCRVCLYLLYLQQDIISWPSSFNKWSCFMETHLAMVVKQAPPDTHRYKPQLLHLFPRRNKNPILVNREYCTQNWFLQ